MEIAHPFVDHEREKEFEVSLPEIVLAICSEYECEIFIFGSRARGDIKRSSDFDLGIRGLSAAAFSDVRRRIVEEVEEGNIPHEVDVVDFDRASEPFRSMAFEDRSVWKKA